MLKTSDLKNLIATIQKCILLEHLSLECLFVEIQGIKIPVGYNFSKDMRYALYSNNYETEVLQVLSTQLCENNVVMEPGTGVGLVSSYCAKLIGSNQVFTYEANPYPKPHIPNTYKLNSVFPSVEICLLGEQTFYIEKDFWASSTVQLSSKVTAVKVPVKSIYRQVIRINPTFLIIEIEGGEYELCQYASFHNVQKIMIELHEKLFGPDKAELVKPKLSLAGYRLNKESSRKDEVLIFRKS